MSDEQCQHDSLSGDEGPVRELGRMPVRWRCDECDAIVYDDVNNFIEPFQAAVVTTINTLGTTLLGPEFTPITASPIPDDDVARILASDQGEDTRAGLTVTMHRDPVIRMRLVATSWAGDDDLYLMAVCSRVLKRELLRNGSGSAFRP